MSNPVETTPPPSTEDGFDPLEFWIRHRAKIILYALLLLIALIAYGIYEYTQRRARTQAAQALAQAQTTEQLKALTDEHAGSHAAANALLLLADKLRDEGKLAESDTQLRNFIQSHPEHQMITGAYTSLATNAEAQGKLDEALAHFRKVTGTYPASFSAPVAWLGQARILQAQGKIDEARRAYETVITQFAETSFAQEAFRLSGQLPTAPMPPVAAEKATPPQSPEAAVSAETPAPAASEPVPAPSASEPALAPPAPAASAPSPTESAP